MYRALVCYRLCSHPGCMGLASLDAVNEICVASPGLPTSYHVASALLAIVLTPCTSVVDGANVSVKTQSGDSIAGPAEEWDMDLQSFLKKKKKKKHHKKGVSPSPTPSPGHKHKKDATSAGTAVGEHLTN